MFGLWHETGHTRGVMEIRRMTTDTQNMPLRERWYVRVSGQMKLTVLQNHINPLNPELNPICYLLALLGAHHFLHVRG